jgi:AcrR family transcriptional regulator
MTTRQKSEAKDMARGNPVKNNPTTIDHRIEVGIRRRAAMRARLLRATMDVLATAGAHAPAIEDVAREAGVSRGTFYLHFLSLEEAVHAVSREQSDQMTRDVYAFYDVLKEPWQRFAVGFRLFLKRAAEDSLWASFVTRSITASDELLFSTFMKDDLVEGQQKGMFTFLDPAVAVDCMKGISVACIYALGQGVPDPETYMDGSLRMALAGLGCTPEMADRGVQFSRMYLEGMNFADRK